MKMKKLAAFVLGAALVLNLSACGGSGAGNQAAGQGGESQGGKVIEVNFPTFLAGENVGAVFFLPQVERFNKKYEGKYKINIEEVPQAAYEEKIKQLAQQDKLPVILHAMTDTQWFKQVALANNMAYDLTGFADKHADVKANWVPESIDFCTVDGKLICKPIAVLKPVGLYYNAGMYSSDKEIKDQTIDEFIKGLGKNKLAFQTADNGWTTGLLLTALIANKDGGTKLLSDAADDKLWDYNNPIIIESVKELKQLMQNNASSNSFGAAYADAANAFMSKNASIICNGSWMASEFDEGSSDKWSNGFDGKDVKATLYPGNVAIVNPRVYGEFWISNSATAGEKELAEAFLAFRDSQEEIEGLLLAEGGSAPQIKYSDDFLKKQKESRILYELSQGMDDKTTYAVSLFDIMPASVANVEFGKLLPKLIDDTLSPEQFCKELTKKAEEAKQ